jgi:hypothetical protein
MNGFAFWVQDNFLKKRPVPMLNDGEVTIEMTNSPTKEKK